MGSAGAGVGGGAARGADGGGGEGSSTGAAGAAAEAGAAETGGAADGAGSATAGADGAAGAADGAAALGGALLSIAGADGGAEGATGATLETGTEGVDGIDDGAGAEGVAPSSPARSGCGAGRECAGAELSGRPTARRFTTVGRIRSSTTAWAFCFSKCRFTRSTASGAIALMWFFASVTPTDCSSATSALFSNPRSRATSYTRILVVIQPPMKRSSAPAWKGHSAPRASSNRSSCRSPARARAP